jgi:hypothetical protein
MSGRVNWSRIDSRNRMRRQGVEDVKGKTPIIEPTKKPRRKVSKAELREQGIPRLARGPEIQRQVVEPGVAERPKPSVILRSTPVGCSATARRG